MNHRQNLIYLLQNAHAGERAAANAYYGHATSIYITSEERTELFAIYKEELHHRERLKLMLSELGAKPRFLRELGMWLIGASIGFLCWFGGWFIPMYGAGRLESANVEEYEVAAQLAMLSGLKHLVDELIEFAEVEWDHENYFFTKAQAHWLKRFFPDWQRPGERHHIRIRYNQREAVSVSKQQNPV